jgi:uncharacterized protein YggU (UPF0235/DUF167 family)
MRVSVRVAPGSSRTEVGGRYGTTDPPVLIVRVHAPAVDGKANVAVTEAVAIAFEVKRSAVRLIAGRASRNKVIEVRGGDPATLTSLLTQKQ